MLYGKTVYINLILTALGPEYIYIHKYSIHYIQSFHLFYPCCRRISHLATCVTLFSFYYYFNLIYTHIEMIIDRHSLTCIHRSLIL